MSPCFSVREFLCGCLSSLQNGIGVLLEPLGRIFSASLFYPLVGYFDLPLLTRLFKVLQIMLGYMTEEVWKRTCVGCWWRHPESKPDKLCIWNWAHREPEAPICPLALRRNLPGFVPGFAASVKVTCSRAVCSPRQSRFRGLWGGGGQTNWLSELCRIQTLPAVALVALLARITRLF